MVVVLVKQCSASGPGTDATVTVRRAECWLSAETCASSSWRYLVVSLEFQRLVYFTFLRGAHRSFKPVC